MFASKITLSSLFALEFMNVFISNDGKRGKFTVKMTV